MAALTVVFVCNFKTLICSKQDQKLGLKRKMLLYLSVCLSVCLSVSLSLAFVLFLFLFLFFACLFVLLLLLLLFDSIHIDRDCSASSSRFPFKCLLISAVGLRDNQEIQVWLGQEAVPLSGNSTPSRSSAGLPTVQGTKADVQTNGDAPAAVGLASRHTGLSSFVVKMPHRMTGTNPWRSCPVTGH